MAYRFQTEPSGTTLTVAPALAETPAIPALRPRLDGIDFLRGLVMAIMVLDHARDYFGSSSMNPRDVHDAGLFLTRWITHYCAPIFVFLAGVSAFLYAGRGRSRRDVARFLLTRGIWLILIELTLVRFAWTFNVSYDFVLLQVIWAIGCSMVALAGLIFLPRWALVAFSVAAIAGHNMLDGIDARSFGSFSWLWTLLHAPSSLHPTASTEVLVLYPLVPWIAVMAAGYALGPVFQRNESERRRALLALGTAVVVGFVVLRVTNLYGDSQAWSWQGDLLATLLSFINCEKYPPSLLYLAMTLGPGLLLLAWFSSARNAVTRAIVTIGRVPFLFYVAHIMLLHAMAVVVASLTIGDTDWLFRGLPFLSKPDGYGLSLPAIYVLWIAALVLLYPVSRWFAAVKQRRKDWWLSYL
jgi:uncharacterized membrane protein